MKYGVVVLLALVAIWGGALGLAKLMRGRKYEPQLSEMEDIATISADDS